MHRNDFWPCAYFFYVIKSNLAAPAETKQNFSILDPKCDEEYYLKKTIFFHIFSWKKPLCAGFLFATTPNSIQNFFFCLFSLCCCALGDWPLPTAFMVFYSKRPFCTNLKDTLGWKNREVSTGQLRDYYIIKARNENILSQSGISGNR